MPQKAKFLGELPAALGHWRGGQFNLRRKTEIEAQSVRYSTTQVAAISAAKSVCAEQSRLRAELLAVDFDQAPVGDQHFGAGSHGTELAGDFDLFTLGRLGEPLLETSNLLTALLPLLKFRFAFAKAQVNISACRCRVSPKCQASFLLVAASPVNAGENGPQPQRTPGPD